MKTLYLLFTSLCITVMLQAQVSKTIEVTAGGLKTMLTAEELNTETNLTLTGTIDARDFKTMRDDMPLLAVLDMSRVAVAAYRGTEGTSGVNKSYFANRIPDNAFHYKTNLITVLLPSFAISIGQYAFSGCGLTSLSIPSEVTSIGEMAFWGCDALKTVTIPSSVVNMGGSCFAECNELASIYVNSSIPLDLSSSLNIFEGVDKTTCILNVPYRSKSRYLNSNQWKDFSNIVEAEGFLFGPTNLILSSNDTNSATVDLLSNIPWTISSDKSWLTVTPSSGSGNMTLTLNAGPNIEETSRIALLTVSAEGFDSQTITLTQLIAPTIVRGNDLDTLSEDILNSITNLKLKDTIFENCFYALRDKMPSLSILDLSEANMEYWFKNAFPSRAFYSRSNWDWDWDWDWYEGQGKISLNSIILPSSITSIGSEAFRNCSGLTSITIPPLVATIGDYAFAGCSGLTSITFPSKVSWIGNNAFLGCNNLTTIVVKSYFPFNNDYNAFDIFSGLNLENCTLYVPFGCANTFSTDYFWQDFPNIFEMKGFKLTARRLNIAARQGSTTSIDIKSDVSWTANSDQFWLTVNKTSGSGNQSVTFTAEANPDTSTRIAKVTVSAEGVESQIITITQLTLPVGLNDISENSTQIKCYPNPFTDEISFEILNFEHAEITVDIYNLDGERIKNLAIQQKDEKLELKWNGTNYAGIKVVPGVYICKVNNRSKQLVYLGQKGN